MFWQFLYNKFRLHAHVSDLLYAIMRSIQLTHTEQAYFDGMVRVYDARKKNAPKKAISVGLLDDSWQYDLCIK